MKNKFKVQRGYTLIELSIGLAVTSLVIASVVVGVEKLLKSFSTTRTVNQISAAAGKIKSVIKRDPDVSYVTKANFTSGVNNAFESFVVVGGGSATADVFSALGYPVGLMTLDNKGWDYANGSIGYLVSKQFFVITMSGPEPATCFDLVSSLEGETDAIYFVYTDGQLRNIKPSGGPFSVSVARDACALPFNNAGNVLLFQYRK